MSSSASCGRVEPSGRLAVSLAGRCVGRRAKLHSPSSSRLYLELKVRVGHAAFPKASEVKVRLVGLVDPGSHRFRDVGIGIKIPFLVDEYRRRHPMLVVTGQHVMLATGGEDAAPDGFLHVGIPGEIPRFIELYVGD